MAFKYATLSADVSLGRNWLAEQVLAASSEIPENASCFNNVAEDPEILWTCDHIPPNNGLRFNGNQESVKEQGYAS